MKFSLSSFAILLFIFISSFSFGQNFKTEVKMIDSSNASINAGLFLTGITKSGLDELVSKMNVKDQFLIRNEFFAEKNAANISLRSNNKASLKDFELFLKQIEIYSIVYKNKTMSSQELAGNYKHYKKEEIKKIDRIK
jgi:hypothetical protein